MSGRGWECHANYLGGFNLRPSLSDTKVSKEFYIFDSKKTGIKANRRLVSINLAYVVGFSSLEKIKEF